MRKLSDLYEVQGSRVCWEIRTTDVPPVGRSLTGKVRVNAARVQFEGSHSDRRDDDNPVSRDMEASQVEIPGQGTRIISAASRRYHFSPVKVQLQVTTN